MNKLAKLNEYRAAQGKKPLKAWKEAAAKLEGVGNDGKVRLTVNKTIVLTHNATISIAAKWLDDSTNATLTDEQRAQAKKNYEELIATAGTVIGTLLGERVLLGLSPDRFRRDYGSTFRDVLPPVRGGSWFVTQFFRNSPWLVLLFYCMLLLPFEVNIGGTVVPLPVSSVR